VIVISVAAIFFSAMGLALEIETYNDTDETDLPSPATES
jgi:hypothetical protein